MAVSILRTLQGLLRLLQLLFLFIGFVCILAIGTTPRGDAFLVATIGGFIIILLILLLKILDLDQKITIPWPTVELIFNLVWGLFLLITSALVIDVRSAGYIAGGCFGLFAMVAIFIDAFDKYSAR